MNNTTDRPSQKPKSSQPLIVERKVVSAKNAAIRVTELTLSTLAREGLNLLPLATAK